MEPVHIKSASGFMQAKEKYPIDYVLDLVRGDRGRVVLDGDLVWVDSLRLKCFAHHGVECVSCHAKPSFFRKERHAKDDKYHLNLYGVGSSGREVLFTADHIVTRYDGGEDVLGNLQTMCFPCNQRKGNGHTQKEALRKSHVRRKLYVRLACHVLVYRYGGGWVGVEGLYKTLKDIYPDLFVYSYDDFKDVVSYRRFTHRTEFNESKDMVRIRPWAEGVRIPLADPGSDLYGCFFEQEAEDIIAKGILPMAGLRMLFTKLHKNEVLDNTSLTMVTQKKMLSRGTWVRLRASEAYRDGVSKFSTVDRGVKWVVWDRVPPEYIKGVGCIGAFK